MGQHIKPGYAQLEGELANHVYLPDSAKNTLELGRDIVQHAAGLAAKYSKVNLMNPLKLTMDTTGYSPVAAAGRLMVEPTHVTVTKIEPGFAASIPTADGDIQGLLAMMHSRRNSSTTAWRNR